MFERNTRFLTVKFRKTNGSNSTSAISMSSFHATWMWGLHGIVHRLLAQKRTLCHAHVSFSPSRQCLREITSDKEGADDSNRYVLNSPDRVGGDRRDCCVRRPPAEAGHRQGRSDARQPDGAVVPGRGRRL